MLGSCPFLRAEGLDYLIKRPSLTSMAESTTDLGIFEPLDAVDLMARSESRLFDASIAKNTLTLGIPLTG